MKEMAATHARKNESASLQRHPGSVSRARRETKAENGSLKGWAKPLICRGCRSSLGDLQPKLVVGPADDEYEREADRVADQAVSMPESRVQRACTSCGEDESVQREPLAAQITPLVQRQVKPEEEEEEEKLQTKPLSGQITPLVQRQVKPEEEDEEEKIQTKPLAGRITPLVQRQVEPEEEEEKVQTKRLDDLVQNQEGREEEEEKLQAKSLVQRVGSTEGNAVPQLEQSLTQARGNGRPLAEGVRGRMERSFGVDFGSVRIHSDAQADELNRSIHARAFTRGHDIFLSQGEYQPASAGGQRLLAHELTHVVQQNGGAERQPHSNMASSKVIQRGLFDWIRESLRRHRRVPVQAQTFTFDMYAKATETVPSNVEIFYTGPMGDCVTIIAMWEMNNQGRYRHVIGRHMFGGVFKDQAQAVMNEAPNEAAIYVLASSMYKGANIDPKLRNGDYTELEKIGVWARNPTTRSNAGNYKLDRSGQVSMA